MVSRDEYTNYEWYTIFPFPPKGEDNVEIIVTNVVKYTGRVFEEDDGISIEFDEEVLSSPEWPEILAEIVESW